MKFNKSFNISINFSLVFIGLLVLIPGITDFIDNSPHHYNFIIMGILQICFGMVMSIFALVNQTHKQYFTPRFSLSVVIQIWVYCCILSALPFYFYDKHITFTDSLFESVSGLTSCGATIFEHLQRKSKGFLLWRAILNYVGGLGIVVIGMAVLPNLRIGGMQMFNMEFTEKSDKMLPKVEKIAIIITSIYLTTTFFGALSLKALGMSFFDAICHSMTAIATGGFTNYDNSIAYFKNPAIDLVLMLLMLLGGISFIHFYNFKDGNFKNIFSDIQFRYYIYIIIILVSSVGLYNYSIANYSLTDAFHFSAFNIISAYTTTGFNNFNYDQWHQFPKFCMLFAAIIGGMTGSTSGGIKVYRLIILFKAIMNYINTLMHPHGIFKLHYNGKNLSDQTINGALLMVLSYFMLLIIGTLILSLTNYDAITIFSSVIAAISNAGFGIGELIGPKGSFAIMPDFAKWTLLILMLVARLEIIVFFVLLNRNFWQK